MKLGTNNGSGKLLPLALLASVGATIVVITSLSLITYLRHYLYRHHYSCTLCGAGEGEPGIRMPAAELIGNEELVRVKRMLGFGWLKKHLFKRSKGKEKGKAKHGFFKRFLARLKKIFRMKKGSSDGEGDCCIARIECMSH